ncbi:fad-dependent oxidoreductase [Anaeramoeba ignava]|uniref:Fad-dependent oxidoreductase n=1 Tax=Anaeramoeba ignava TaxID=1746090 RepID=A0A9Q0LLP7_ANAIG|nr:fad-dependent oxidoreductase [Anaeramoeba ignava]|eukprot:Anaeramoba_ignava/a554_136.p1 GENE.a554_136~~a554_136.p1  ORF type:complete len:895 (-),score=320.13 a554_136:57-2741(-)
MTTYKAEKIYENVHWVGALDPDLRVFDIVMFTPYGTTYNAFLIEGKEKVALIETVKNKKEFYDQMISRIDSVLSKDKKIDYFIHNHTEPDHSGGSYKLLKERYPEAKIIGTLPALNNLKNIANSNDFETIEANNDLKIDLGGLTLNFIIAPFLHWPDSMFTYCSELKALFTCDFFGAHFNCPQVFNDLINNPKDIDNLWEATKYYFDTIFGPFKKYVNQGLDSIQNLEIQTICCSHGPVLRKDIEKYKNLYREWAKEKNVEKKIVIAYVSAYGYTEEMANSIKKGMEKSNEIPVEMYDLLKEDKAKVIEAIDTAEGIVFGTPTIISEALPPIWDLALHLNATTHSGRYSAVFGSYGWSGEGPLNIDQRLRQARLETPIEPLRIMFKPSEKDLEDCENWGNKFVRIMKGEKFEPRNDLNRKRRTRSSRNGILDNTPKRWKCLVCGEIVISANVPEICPVCGAGAEAFMLLDDIKETTKPEETSFEGTIVVIGAGGAGIEAVKSIRERNKKCKVILINGEEFKPYYRPSLTRALADTSLLDSEKFYIFTDKFADENNVQILHNKIVIDIEVENKNVVIKDQKEKIHFDKLIIATGGNNFCPFKQKPEDFSNVFGVRKLSDVTMIKQEVDKLKKTKEENKKLQACVIGGGLLGIEAAEALIELGLGVDLVEVMPRILPRQLDQEGSLLFQKILTEKGIRLLLGVSVNELIVDGDRATGVLFKDSKPEKVSCDLVIFAIGVRAEISLGMKIGLKTNRGIIVDTKMESSIKDIYACGDCAECGSPVIQNWTNAIDQGRIAGLSSVGVTDAEFKRVATPYALFVFNSSVFSVGLIPSDNSDPSLSILSLNKNSSNVYLKLFFINDILIAGIVIGDTALGIQVQDAVEAKSTYQETIEQFF